MHKKIIISFFFIALLSFVSAENCRYQNELTTDCNIMVKPLDSNSNECTSSCACNLTLYNPSYVIRLDNASMNWDSRLHSFWYETTTSFNVTGEWIADVNCFALDTNRYSIGQIMIVDRDTNKLLHDVNSSLISASDVWNNATRTLTDYNQSLTFTYLEDINISCGNGVDCPTETEIWTHATRTLTDYNQSTLWNWLRPLYNQWYLTFAPRYCAIDDDDCIKGISKDSNQRVYSEFTETPTILTFLAENWIWGTVIVIIIFIIAVIVLKGK